MSSNQRVDIGVLRRLRARCISETGWFDVATLLGDVKAAGGMSVSRYQLFGNLHPDNTAGASALIGAEEMDGTSRRLLFDTGWGLDWARPRWLRNSERRVAR